MTEQEEKAAKYAEWERYKDAKQRLTAIVGQLSAIGKAWEPFARNLQQLESDSVFELNGENGTSVDAGHHTKKETLARLEKTDVDWNGLRDLLSDYMKTKQQLQNLEARVRVLGFNPLD